MLDSVMKFRVYKIKPSRRSWALDEPKLWNSDRTDRIPYCTDFDLDVALQ
jgi:hypothetical protein